MGSFQQIFMGGTCLFAAFLFGSYLHNRPAQQTVVGQSDVASSDLTETLFAFGKRDSKPPLAVPVATSVNKQNHRSASTVEESFIDPSELAPVLVSNPMPDMPLSQAVAASTGAPLPRKPVVPDFSELASRFKNTPLDLRSTGSVEPERDPIHASERVEFSGTFKAPEMVIRQPENLMSRRGLDESIERIDQAGRRTLLSTESVESASRWRVDRSGPDPSGSFQAASRRETFRQPAAIKREPRQTIEDVVSGRSADWLNGTETEQVEFQSNRRDVRVEPESTQDFARNELRSEGWNSLPQRRATEQAADRNRDLLDIEDPGNRFRSGQDVAYADPPKPNYSSSYYRPTQQRQDGYPQPQNRLRERQTRLRSIQDRSLRNVGRQSNFDQDFGRRYEIQSGDTLQSISTEFYGTPEHYLSIYRANRDVLDRITSSPVGVVIEIPHSGEINANN